jgi:prepilin-type N-terminal cleavage/methylation domain-containing protein
MAHTFHSSSHQSGVTVIELLVVIVVIAIVAAFALLHRGAANEQLTRRNSAQQLKTALERARFDSVKRRAECDSNKSKVVVNSDSFVLWTDKDLDGTPETSEAETIEVGRYGITIQGIALTLPVTVAFNQRGEVIASDGAGTSTFPGFLICNGTCSGTPSSSDANKVYVTPTGTASLLGGAESPPTFGVPGGTTIGTGVEINNSMLLSTSTGCS